MSFYSFLKQYKNFNFKAYSEALTNNDIIASLNKERLENYDFLNLLSDKAIEFIEEMAIKSRIITRRLFGNTI